MLVRRLGLAMAVGALAAASLVSSPATAAGAPAASTQVASHHTAAAAPSSALRRHKQKKLRLSLTITPEGTIWNYTFTVTTKRGVPVAGVKFKPQYHATKGKWSDEGLTYVSDANGRFSLISCSITSKGVERMHSKATKRHKEVSLTYVLNYCG
jgi:hypothetical protein